MEAEPKAWRAFERKSGEFDEILPEGAKVERLATGFRFIEGPVWNSAGGYYSSATSPPTRSRGGRLARAQKYKTMGEMR